MTGSDGQRGERSTAGVAAGSLSALLKELARLPGADQGAAWDSWLKPGAVIGRFESSQLLHGDPRWKSLLKRMNLPVE